MGKGPPPAWNRRDCRFDHLVAAAISKGYGVILKYTGIEDLDRAHDIRRGIYRCAKHRGLTADAGPSGQLVDDAEQMGVRKIRGKYELWYRIWDKRTGRKRHLERHGTDRSAWPYDPRRRATAEERETWANRNERGEPVIH